MVRKRTISTTRAVLMKNSLAKFKKISIFSRKIVTFKETPYVNGQIFDEKVRKMLKIIQEACGG